MDNMLRKIKEALYSNSLVRMLRDFYLKLKYGVNRSYLREYDRRLRYAEKLVRRHFNMERRPKENVVLIIVDCIRFRNTSLAGYERRTTPFLERLRVRLRSIAAAPQTYSSVPSILSGLYPHNHGAVIGGVVKHFDNLENFKLTKANALTVLEVLKSFGYDTYFITSIYTAFMPVEHRVIPDIVHGNADRVLKVAFKKIRASAKSNTGFIAYIHLGDLHEPLNPPSKFRHFFGKVKKLPNIERWDYRRPEEQKGRKFEEYKYNRILLYDNTLRFVDHAIERFIYSLEELGVLDSTLIIITGDHGEEFWEHASLEARFFYDPRGFYGVGHGHNVFNEIIEVPLIIEGPDIGKITKMYSPNMYVSNVDIVPTVFEWLGLEHSPYLDGVSLLSQKRRGSPILSEGVGYGYEKKALLVGDKKLLLSHHDKVAWLFDLSVDPYETSPSSDTEDIPLYVNLLKKMLVRDLAFRTRAMKTI